MHAAYTFQAERKVFSCDDLKKFLMNEIPAKVAIQANTNYAVYYRHKEQKTLRIVLSFKPANVRIVTFYILDKGQLPRG